MLPISLTALVLSINRLKRLLDFQLQQFIVPLTEVSDQASKEWAIEKAVQRTHTTSLPTRYRSYPSMLS
jgi:hypothetical protein